MNKDLKEREPFNLKLSFLIAITITLLACLTISIVRDKRFKTMVFKATPIQLVDLDDTLQEFQRQPLSEVQQISAQAGAEVGQPVIGEASGAVSGLEQSYVEASSNAYEFSDVEIRPIPIQKYCISAEYPESMKKEKIEGTVIIEGVIDTTGLVIGARVVSSINPQLDESALKAFGQWRFFPAKQRDKSVKVKLMVPMRFSINQ